MLQNNGHAYIFANREIYAVEASGVYTQPHNHYPVDAARGGKRDIRDYAYIVLYINIHIYIYMYIYIYTCV